MLSPFLSERCDLKFRLRRPAGEDLQMYDVDVYVDEFRKLGTLTQYCHRFQVNDVSKFKLRRATGEDLKMFEVDVYVDGLIKLGTLNQNTVIAKEIK